MGGRWWLGGGVVYKDIFVLNQNTVEVKLNFSNFTPFSESVLMTSVWIEFAHIASVQATIAIY